MNLMVGILLGLVFALPCMAEEIPGEVQQLLAESPLTVEGFLGMGLRELLEWLAEPLHSQLHIPAEFLVKSAAYLLLAAMAMALLRDSGSRAAVETAATMGFAALCALPLSGLDQQIQEATQRWHTYLCSFVPVYSGILAAQGQPAAGAVYDGLFLGISALAVQFIGMLFLPLVQGYLCISAAVELWGNPGALDGAAMVYKAANWVLKVLTGLMAGLLCLQGTFASAADKAAAKGVETVVKLVLPVVGDLAIQAAGGVLAGLKLIKGALAFAAIVYILLAFLPLFGLCVGLLVCFWGISAGARAVGLTRCGGMAEHFGNGVQLCASVLALYFFLVVFATILMLIAGGGG